MEEADAIDEETAVDDGAAEIEIEDTAAAAAGTVEDD